MSDDRSKLFLRLLPVLVLAVVALLYLGWRYVLRPQPTAPATTEVAIETPLPELPPGSAFAPLEREWLEITGSPPVWPDDFDRPADCSAALDGLRGLADRVDAGDYARQSGVSAGTFELLLNIAEDLDRRRPTIGMRLDDGSAMRANIAHFLITLGPERLARLVELTRSESRMAEPLALSAYQWLRAGDRCPEGMRPPAEDVQYDYAAFLLQTIGGQAYLRRRAPRIEALTSFYALLIADHAVQRKHNPHGVDLRPEIRRCRALMEGMPLVFRSQYLRLLDELEGRWKTLSGDS
jgi:hypothetical protein